MSRRKQVIFLIVGIIITLGSLYGCQGKTSQSKDKVDDENITTITWWSFPVFSQENSGDPLGTYEQKLIDAFEEIHPDIKVNLKMIDFTTGPEKLDVAIQNDSACDVLLDAPGRIIAYGKEGALASLDDMFTSDFIADVDNENLINSCKGDDVAYMYPLSSSPFYMAFNKEYLEKAGVLDLVKEGWTTDDFTTVIEALRAEGYVAGSVFCNGSGGDQGTRAFVSNLYSNPITDEALTKYTVDQENGVKALEYIKNAVDNGYLLSGNMKNGSDVISDFVSGKTAFTLLWGASQQSTNSSELEKNGIETVEVPFPSEDGKAELEYLVNGFAVFDNGDEKKIEASKEFVKFLCDDETYGPANVVRTGCVPVRSSFGDLYDDERMKTIGTWTKYYSTYYNTIDGFANMRGLWTNMLNSILSGDKAPEKATADFVSEANKTIEGEE